MDTIATVCQSKVPLMLLLDGLCNGAKTISVQLKEKKIRSRVEDHLKVLRLLWFSYSGFGLANLERTALRTRIQNCTIPRIYRQ